jgi:hypothetical protein
MLLDRSAFVRAFERDITLTAPRGHGCRRRTIVAGAFTAKFDSRTGAWATWRSSAVSSSSDRCV